MGPTVFRPKPIDKFLGTPTRITGTTNNHNIIKYKTRVDMKGSIVVEMFDSSTIPSVVTVVWIYKFLSTIRAMSVTGKYRFNICDTIFHDEVLLKSVLVGDTPLGKCVLCWSGSSIIPRTQGSSGKSSSGTRFQGFPSHP